MARYITGIGVSRNQPEEQQLQAQGFTKISVTLNQDSAGNAAHMWYKKKKGESPITRIQFTFNEEMCEGLKKAGYRVEEKPIVTAEGPVTIWDFCGSTQYDIPIEDYTMSLTPDREAELLKGGWEKIGCSLSVVCGASAFGWVKRSKPTYICDVTATNSYEKDAELFRAGYTRIDQTTNTIFSGFRSTNFLWYRSTTDAESAILDLQLSTSPDEYQQYTQQLYTLIDVNLNEGTGGRTVYLWYRNGLSWVQKQPDSKPVKTMMLLHYDFPIQTFEEAGIKVIKKNINDGNTGLARFLCVLKEN